MLDLGKSLSALEKFIASVAEPKLVTRVLLLIGTVCLFLYLTKDISEWTLRGVAVAFGTLIVFLSWEASIKQLAKFSEKLAHEKTTKAIEAGIRSHLDTRSAEERFILSFCVDNRQRSFEARIDEAVINTLRHKHMISAGPQGNMLSYPFTITDRAWSVLQTVDVAVGLRNERGFSQGRDRYMGQIKGIGY